MVSSASNTGGGTEGFFLFFYFCFALMCACLYLEQIKMITTPHLKPPYIYCQYPWCGAAMNSAAAAPRRRSTQLDRIRLPSSVSMRGRASLCWLSVLRRHKQIHRCPDSLRPGRHFPDDGVFKETAKHIRLMGHTRSKSCGGHYLGVPWYMSRGSGNVLSRVSVLRSAFFFFPPFPPSLFFRLLFLLYSSLCRSLYYKVTGRCSV